MYLTMRNLCAWPEGRADKVSGHYVTCLLLPPGRCWIGLGLNLIKVNFSDIASSASDHV